jgi:hypothetical protein
MTKPLYLPQRVLSGSMKADGLEIGTREKKDFLPWNKIKLLCLGIVEEPFLESPTNFYLQLKQALKNLFFAEKREKQEEQKRQILYLEIFVEDEQQPFRIESTSLDYRGFLDKVEYVSENNFKLFLKKLVEQIPDCVLDESIHAFLNNKKSVIRRFGNLYEFQRECQERWLKQQEEKGENP